MMLIYIRADASNLIGSGHIMRCLTLADMLKKEGHKVIFICRDLPGNFSDLITQRGYLCRLLKFSKEQKKHYLSLPCQDNYPAWLGVSSQDDATETIEYLQNKSADLLVVDHYSLDYVWEKACQPYCKKIMVIDDLANRKHHCDIILDHNFYSNAKSRYNNLVPEACKKLLGPKYALLSPKLRQIKINREQKNKGMQPETIDNIVIFMGGMDPQNYTDKALAMVIKSPQLKHALFHIVLGKHNSHKLALKQKYAAYDNIVFHIQPNYYFTLLENADLAIGAGGVAQLERMYINLPSVIVEIADNQSQIVNDSVNFAKGVSLLDNNFEASLEELFDGEIDVEFDLLDIYQLGLYCTNAINIITPCDGWFFQYAANLKYNLESKGFLVNLLSHHTQIQYNSNISIFLSYPFLIPTEHLGLSKNNIVIHASDLPKGRGWSPWVWEIINGSNNITLTLFELTEALDAGPIYFKEILFLEGHELIDEIREKMAQQICDMCYEYVLHHKKYTHNSITQKGQGSYYKKRNSKDSKLDINKTLLENFNLLRVVDNKSYPAFFQYKGFKYVLHIYKA